MPSARGIRTRVMLVAALIGAIVTVTGGSLLIVRNRVRQQVSENLSADLSHSLATFQNLQRQRRKALIHENALLADLPSLKALMTTRDRRTIADGAVEFWKVSSSDLFALSDSSGNVLTVDIQGKPPSPALRQALQGMVTDPRKHYLVSDDRIFDFSVRPLYFGSEARGTLLGYVISGYAVDRAFLDLISQASAAESTFLADRQIVTSTLSPRRRQDLVRKQFMLSPEHRAPLDLALAGEHYLATEADLSAEAAVPLRLVVLKSFDQANRATQEINRLVLLLGLAAILLGSTLMLALSGMVTRPLEMLASGVRAFGFGDPEHPLPDGGTQEVRELSEAFARMRSEIQETNRALLEAEKLATIGRMASSVSHDLRHYLAAVYANAEFLSSPRLTDEERIELFADIQMAVHGTTELIDSLLIFSRNGAGVRRARESVILIVERAIALLRAHPDAAGVAICTSCEQGCNPEAVVDARQLERAVYNLLLNACQSARRAMQKREVRVSIASSPSQIEVTVTDSGPGVAEHIRDSLFEPFVSDGKQSGTGLGLTLAHCIAEEHGGAVTLISSRPGETVFELSLRTQLVEPAAGVGPENSTATRHTAEGELA